MRGLAGLRFSTTAVQTNAESGTVKADTGRPRTTYGPGHGPLPGLSRKALGRVHEPTFPPRPRRRRGHLPRGAARGRSRSTPRRVFRCRRASARTRWRPWSRPSPSWSMRARAGGRQARPPQANAAYLQRTRQRRPPAAHRGPRGTGGGLRRRRLRGGCPRHSADGPRRLRRGGGSDRDHLHRPVTPRPGSTATLTGRGFSPTMTDDTVTIGGATAATVTGATSTTLTVTVPCVPRTRSST